jgi:MFS transporter, DHA2 family, multidrug resistance protein
MPGFKHGIFHRSTSRSFKSTRDCRRFLENYEVEAPHRLQIITIPLSGWLASSVRRYLLVNAMLFLVFSMACAQAHDFEQMIAMRAVQGFTGGVLIPLAFNIIISHLPKSQQPIGLAMFAVSATFAPAIGPTIGGYLTENWSWQYIFYVNLVPGSVMLGMLWFSLEKSPMQLDLLKQVDLPGIITMAIGLAALQTVLEEGNKDDWFGSPFIVRLTIIAAISLPLFVWIELKTERPLVNLRLLARRNFGFGTLGNFLLGFSLYGSVQYKREQFHSNVMTQSVTLLEEATRARIEKLTAFLGAWLCRPGDRST